MEDNYLSLFLAYAKSRSFENVRVDGSRLEFQYKTLQFVFIFDSEKDPNFVRLMLPRIDHYAYGNVEQNGLIQTLNSKYKVGKGIVIEDLVWLSVEQFVYASGGEIQMFDRMMGLLIQMYNEYRSEISNL